MNKVKITITVDKRKWLQAVSEGYLNRFNEKLPIQDIKGLGCVSDVPWAVETLDLDVDEVELEEVEE